MKRYFIALLAFVFIIATVPFAQAETTRTLVGAVAAYGKNITYYDSCTVRTITRGSKGAIGEAIVLTEKDNNLVTETILITYDEDMNPIALSDLMRGIPYNYGAITLEISASYTYEQGVDLCMYYRPYRVQAKWTTSDTSQSVTGFSIEYNTTSQTYSYPSCLTETDPVPQGTRTHSIVTGKTGPAVNTWYGKTSTFSGYAFHIIGTGASSVDFTLHTSFGTAYDSIRIK